MPRRLTCATVLLLGAALTHPLPAQQRDTTSAATGRRLHQLPPVVVTGSLAATSPDRLGVSHTVVTRDALRIEPVRAAVDALRRQAGVHIDEATGPLGPTIIRLRGGEETFTQVLMDGIALNENGGFLDAQGLTLVNVDRLEIARGPQSALYGSSAMSGVVQAYTRGGEAGPTRSETLLEGGATQTRGTNFRALSEVSGGTDALRFAAGAGSAYDRGAYRLANNVRSNDASLRMDWIPDAPFALSAVARFMGVDAMLPVRNPGITRAPLDPNQRQARSRYLTSVQAAWTPSARWTHRVLAGFYRRDFTYADARDSLDQAQFSSFVFDANYHYQATVQRATARYVGTATGRPRAGLRLALSFGGEWGRESLDDEQKGDFGPASQSVARPSVAAFSEGQAHVGSRLAITVGSRVEKFSGLRAAHVPRATGVVDLIPNRLSLRAAAAAAYKAPNIQDQFPNNPVIVANPDLKPETSRNWELGLEMRSAAGTGTASVTYFRQVYENLIRSVNYDTTGKQINRNLGKSRAAGVELETAVHPRARWTIGADAAWLTTTIVDNGGLPASAFPNGASLPFRPAYTGSVFVDAPLRRPASVRLRARGVGRQTVLTDRFRGSRVDIAPYVVLSATGSWTVSAALDAYAQVENALNRVYDTAYDRPGRPRSLTVGVRVRR